MAKKQPSQKYIEESKIFTRTKQNIRYFAKKWDFSHRINNHIHNFYEMEIVVSGSGVSEINGSVCPVSKGTAYIMRPSDIHSIIPDKDSTLEICNISFKDNIVQNDVFNKIIYNSADNITVLNEEDLNKAVSAFNIIRDYYRDDALKKETLASYVIAIIADLIISNISATPHTLQNTAVIKIIKYIQENFTKEITQKDVAEYAGFSVPYFSQLFKKTIGCGYKEYLLNMRIAHARKIMQTTITPPSEVGYECGFNSSSAFYRAFTQIVGVPPAKYAKDIHLS